MIKNPMYIATPDLENERTNYVRIIKSLEDIGLKTPDTVQAWLKKLSSKALKLRNYKSDAALTADFKAKLIEGTLSDQEMLTAIPPLLNNVFPDIRKGYSSDMACDARKEFASDIWPDLQQAISTLVDEQATAIKACITTLEKLGITYNDTKTIAFQDIKVIEQWRAADVAVARLEELRAILDRYNSTLSPSCYFQLNYAFIDETPETDAEKVKQIPENATIWDIFAKHCRIKFARDAEESWDRFEDLQADRNDFISAAEKARSAAKSTGKTLDKVTYQSVGGKTMQRPLYQLDYLTTPVAATATAANVSVTYV